LKLPPREPFGIPLAPREIDKLNGGAMQIKRPEGSIPAAKTYETEVEKPVSVRQEQISNVKSESESAQAVLRSPQLESSLANVKKAELTEALASFEKVKADAEARLQQELDHAVENAVDDLLSGNGSGIVGGSGLGAVRIDLPGSETTTPPESTTEPKEEPLPIPTADSVRQQKELTDLLASNRMKATTSVREEQVRNLKNESPQPIFGKREIDPSFGNAKQAEFTEAMSKFQKSQERSAFDGITLDGITGSSGLDDLLDQVGNPLDSKKNDEPVAESNHKQQQLTDLFISTKDKLD
jgi:hypothetical protein